MTKKEMLEVMIDASNIKDKEKAIRLGLKRRYESIARVYDHFLNRGVEANFCIALLTGLSNAKR
jgi:hypothetical protein